MLGASTCLRDAQRKILLRAQLQEYVMHFSSWKGIKSKKVWKQHSTLISNCWNIPTAEHIKQNLSGQKRRASCIWGCSSCLKNWHVYYLLWTSGSHKINCPHIQLLTQEKGEQNSSYRHVLLSLTTSKKESKISCSQVSMPTSYSI